MPCKNPSKATPINVSVPTIHARLAKDITLGERIGHKIRTASPSNQVYNPPMIKNIAPSASNVIPGRQDLVDNVNNSIPNMG